MRMEHVAKAVSHDNLWLGINTADKAARVVQNGAALVTLFLGVKTLTIAKKTLNLSSVILGAGALRGVIGGLKFPRDVGWLIRKDEVGHRLFFKHYNQDNIPDYNKGVLGKQIPLFVCHAISFFAFFKAKTPLMGRLSSHCRLIGLSAQFFEQVKRKYETDHWYDDEALVPQEFRASSGAGSRLGTGLDVAYALSEVTLDGFAPSGLAQLFGIASGGYWIAKVWTGLLSTNRPS